VENGGRMDFFWSSTKQETYHNTIRDLNHDRLGTHYLRQTHMSQKQKYPIGSYFSTLSFQTENSLTFSGLAICNGWLLHKVWGSHGRESKKYGLLGWDAVYSCRNVRVMLKSLFSPSSACKKDTSLGTSSLKIRAAVSSERPVSFYLDYTMSHSRKQ
jgi:hypothetical protein